MIARWTLSRIALVLLGPLSGLALAGCPASSGSTPDAASSASSDGAGVPSASAVAAEGSETAATSAPVPAGSIVVSTEPVDAPGPVFTSDGPVDVLIQHGLVYDGSGGPPLRADVVIQGDEIAHVGPTSPELKAKLTVEAKGQAVTPGFIDTHAHGDPTSDNTNFVYQGVTSICLGQDGKSPSDDRIASWAKRNRKKKLRVNSLPFVGHGTARSRTKIGLAKDALSDAQLGKLQDFVAGELAAGAWGLTTGLEYRPGSLAETRELRAIAKPVATADGVIMSHLRSEDDDAIDAALDELLAQAEEGARVHVSHIKVVYGKGEARAEALLDKLEQARRKGYRVTADIYPYNASYTTISIVFPDWAKPPASYKRVKRERRDELLEFLRERVTRRGGPEATLFGTGALAGLTLAEVAQKKGKPFEEVLAFDIGPGGASAAYFVMDDALQSRLLLDPQVMVSTDGGYSSSHPRGYGAFATVIQEHVMKRKALPLQEAVRKMTGLPADTLRLSDAAFSATRRGRLEKGWAADVLVFDPAEIEARASYDKPRRFASGMRWVFVNGRAAIADSKLKSRFAGRILLKQKGADQAEKP